MSGSLGHLLENLFGAPLDAGVLGLLGVLVVALVSLVRGAFVDETKELLKPFIKKYYYEILLVVYFAIILVFQLQARLPYLAQATAAALIIVVLWHYLQPSATRQRLAMAVQAILLLILPLTIALGCDLLGVTPAPGRFIIIHTFDRQRTGSDGKDLLKEEDLLRLSQDYRRKLNDIYKSQFEIKPAQFDDYHKNLYSNSLFDPRVIPILHMENRVRQDSDRICFLVKLHFYDDHVFDMANFISVPARLGNEDQAFLLAAFEITKRLEKRQDIRLTAEDRELIKKAIASELAASWFARGEGKIDANEVEDVQLLLEGSHIPDATLEELLKRHMLVSEDGVTRANKAGRSQYMNYATML